MMVIQENPWKGYVFSRAINNQIIPQRVQNLVIRDYAGKNNLMVQLSLTEYHMNNCFMILDGGMEKMNDIDGIVFYSIFQLPLDDRKRMMLLSKLLEKGKGIRFALEELCVLTKTDIQLIDDIFLVHCITKKDRRIFFL